MRVGYFEQASGRFTALNQHETQIKTHFLTSERRVRELPESDYQ
jgi:hypothetical protein